MNKSIDMDDQEIYHIKKMIRETSVELDLTDRIMESFMPKRTKATGHSRLHQGWRRAMISIASVAAIVIIVTGTGFISPTLAASIKQIPGMNSIFKLAGDLGLKMADEKGLVTVLDTGATHDGLTLRATAITFDGTRVSIGLQREVLDHVQSAESLLAAIKNVELAIDDKDIQTYSAAGYNDVGIFINPTQDQNTAILQFADLKNQGGQALPDTFKLSLELTLSGAQEPFKLTIPVTINTENNLVLNPAIQRKYENINLTLDKIEFTLITTNLTTRIELPEGMKIAELQSSQGMIGYDLFDETGKKIKLISGNGWNAENGNVLITDTRFEPFESIPKSITLKPYKYIYKDNDSYLFQLDADGHVKVEYIPELEITLPVVAQ
ncbi:DUF4179 domain-containing protein [Paenibacillus sp. GCM10012306]|uniref:DUF4179 domain-containing protein n=1 Tax=Paenibacillus sp. GCM10012306 TaxID=3317342 RepID=UPI0036139BF2